MIFYVAIRKTSEDEQSVRYSFGRGDDDVGLLELEKHSGAVRILEALRGDEREEYYMRARRIVVRHAENGEFPDVTCWAS